MFSCQWLENILNIYIASVGFLFGFKHFNDFFKTQADTFKHNLLLNETIYLY